MDNEAAKANQHSTWKSVAPGWKKHDATLRRYAAGATERIVAGLKPGDHVLDVASGTREKAAGRGLKNIEFRRVDGEMLDVPDASFDAVTMRFGLMFMPDPGACLSRARRALKPGAHIALVCWAAPDRNPWASLPIAVLKRHVEVPAPPPGAPGLFAFADAARLRSTIEAAGFSDVKVEEVELTMSDFDTGAEYVAFTLELAGPIAMLFAKLPEAERGAVAEEIAREAERAGGGKPLLKGVALLATGRA
jgi:SAM-dependent methyltransferase